MPVDMKSRVLRSVGSVFTGTLIAQVIPITRMLCWHGKLRILLSLAFAGVQVPLVL